MSAANDETEAYDLEQVRADFEGSREAGRAACQAGILINGGAATALLAFLAGKTGQFAVPGLLVRAACVAFFFYALGVACATLAMWLSAKAGSLFGWAGLDKRRQAKLLSSIDAYQPRTKEYEAAQQARAAWFDALCDRTKRKAWREAWWKVLSERRARPAWFKLIFDRPMLSGSPHLEYAHGYLSLHTGAFYASIICFVVATVLMAVYMGIVLG